MATKTLRVTLADILGPAGPAGRVHGEVWAVFVDGDGNPRQVRYTDGTVVVPAKPRQSLDSTGVVDFVIVPNDDATVHVDDRGFGVKVGWDLTVRGERGAKVPVKSAGVVVSVVTADPATVQFGLKAPYVPVIPGATYQTQGAADARYASLASVANVINGTTAIPYVRTATLNLPVPAYIAHRGGAGIAPEETMEAFRTSFALGADGLEMDCRPLADGALGLMHDTTVTRTTDGTGNASDFTAPAWRALNAAAKFPWNGRVLPPALLAEVIGELGGKTPLVIEPKDIANATQIMDACDAAGVSRSVIFTTSTLDVLVAAKARSFAAYFLWFGTVGATVTVAQAVTAGADYLVCDGTRPDAEITSLVATGKPVHVFTINRRVDKARLLGLGVKGFITDQPSYLKGTTAQRTVDSWRQGVIGHGLLYTQATEDLAVVSGALRLNAQNGLTAIVGEVCPLANAAGTYTINLDLGFNTLPASGGSVIVMIGVPDDKSRSLASASLYSDGYLVLLRATGGISLYRCNDGTSTVVQLGTTATTAALTAGGFAHLTITVTPTTITVTRTDSAGTIGPVTDSTFRGGYIAVGKKDVADGTVHFKNLAIT